MRSLALVSAGFGDQDSKRDGIQMSCKTPGNGLYSANLRRGYMFKTDREQDIPQPSGAFRIIQNRSRALGRIIGSIFGNVREWEHRELEASEP